MISPDSVAPSRPGLPPSTPGVELPEGYRVRHPTADDIPPVAQLIRESDAHDIGAEDFTERDLREGIRNGDFLLDTDTWLVTAPQQQLAAVLFLLQREGRAPEGLGWVHPRHRRRGLGSLLLRLAESRASELAGNAVGHPPVIANWVQHAARDAADLLERSGYRHTRSFYRMAIDLDGPPREPDWPEGVTVRTLERGVDDRAVYAVMTEAFRDHWNHSELDFEAWRTRRMDAPEMDPSLWFLVEADRRLVGGSLCATDGEEGWVETLGVLRAARRTGLGMALLLHSFAELWRRGKRRVVLTVDAQSLTGATRLYERAGMRVDRRYDRYEKELPPSVEPQDPDGGRDAKPSGA